jgi:hypothetical protein
MNVKTHAERMADFEARKAELRAQQNARTAAMHERNTKIREEMRASRNVVSAARAARRELKLGGAEDEPGAGDTEIICPHCRSQGLVTTKRVKIKVKGVSKGRVATAVVLSPITLLMTGISRKQVVTRATCGNCHTTWTIQ